MKNSTLKPDEDIGLKLSDDMKQRDILLLYHDSETRGRDLLKANAKTKSEKLEHSCQRITDVYRDGDESERPDPPVVHGWRRLCLSRLAEECTRHSLTFKREEVTKLGQHD